MILADEDMGFALNMLSIVPTSEIVVWHDGKRYGGFTCRAHAEWFIRKTGKVGATIEEHELPT